MSNPKLQAKERKLFGRRVKQLRAQDLIPANVFGPKTKSKALTLSYSHFLDLFKEAGETSLVDLQVEGEKTVRSILISGVQKHPVTESIIHVDLHQVDLTSKTTAEIPVELAGEAPAVQAGGVLVLLKNDIEAEALPADLPDKFVIDVSKLENVGDNILAKDLKLDRSKVELKIEDEEPVVTIQAQAVEEEPLPSAEPEEETEGADEEAEGAEDKPKEGAPEGGEDKKPDSKDSASADKKDK